MMVLSTQKTLVRAHFIFCSDSKYPTLMQLPPPFQRNLTLRLSQVVFLILCFKDFIYLFLEREERRERNINVWLPLAHRLLRTWPATQACALTRNWTGDPLVCRLSLNPLSHTSQGLFILFNVPFSPHILTATSPYCRVQAGNSWVKWCFSQFWL